MRVRGKHVKKRLVFALMLALLVSMVQPFNSHADEAENEGKVVNTKDEQLGEEGSDGKTLEDNELDENTLEMPNSEQPNERTGNFESDAPVIEKVVFEQNHTMVAKDAEISLSVFVYDASAIKDIQANVTVEGSGVYQTMEWSKGSNEKEYICKYKLDGKTSGRLSISSIMAIDEHGNQSSAYNFDDDPEGYWVDVEESESDAILVKSFDFLQNGQTVDFSAFAEMSMRLELQEPIEEESMWLRFGTGGRGRYFEVELSASDSGVSHSVFDRLSGSYGYNDNFSGGEYALTLQDVYVVRGDFTETISAIMDNKEDYTFTLKVDDADFAKDNFRITSVNMDKVGENVKPGEDINIIVGVKAGEGIELPRWGAVYFKAAASDIETSEQRVELEWNEDDNCYHGTLPTDDLYPYEWYVSEIFIGSAFDDETDDSSYTYEAGYPLYIRVFNGDTFVNPEFDAEIRFMALDENGKYHSIATVTKKNVQRRQSLKEIGVTFPDMGSSYPGVTQVGWMNMDGTEITEDSEIVEPYFNVYAKYDKGIFEVSYKYPNNNGEWSNTDSNPIVYEYGTTYGELMKTAHEFIPNDLMKDYPFSGWECDDEELYDKNEIVSGNRGAFLIADFEGIIALEIYRDYYDQEGRSHRGSEVYTVTKGTKQEDVIKQLNASEAPTVYNGLRFKEWDSYAYLGDFGTAQNGEEYIMNAVYENCLVRYIINGSRLLGSNDEGIIFCQVAEKGETVTALTTFEGFGEVTWDADAAPDKTFVVDKHMTFWGKAETASTTNPSKPSKPSNGSTSGSDNKPGETPDSKLPDHVVDSIVRAVNNAEQGENIKVNMGNKTVISKEVLEAARGKDVSITLIMEGYSWTINGKDIIAANLQDIDLRVIKNTDHIPSTTVRALAGDNPCMQITLVHEGNFGFKATLTIGVGTEHAGKYGNLYYHDSAGKMVFTNAGKINADGDVSLIFSHASNYLLVMSEQEMSQADVPNNLMPTGTDRNGNTSVADGSVRKSAKTGDGAMVYLWSLLCIAAAGTLVYAHRKKEYN